MDDKTWAKKIIFKLEQSERERETKILKLQDMIRHEKNLLETDRHKKNHILSNINKLTENIILDI